MDPAIEAFDFSLFDSEHREIRQGALKALQSLLTQRSRLSKADVKSAAKDVLPSTTVGGPSRESAAKPSDDRQKAKGAGPPKDKKKKKSSISEEETALREQYGPEYASNEAYKAAVRRLRKGKKKDPKQ
jgi:hypothetical protein